MVLCNAIWDSSDKKRVGRKAADDSGNPKLNYSRPPTFVSMSSKQMQDEDTTSGDGLRPCHISGLTRMRSSALNKSLSFTIEERQALGIHGLLPPCVKTVEEQLLQCRAMLDRLDDPLNKFLYVMSLYDFNKTLFFRFVNDNIMEIMPIIYTPIVGEACLKYSLIFSRPRAIYITIYDKGHVDDVLRNWPEHDIKAIVVTDGERILGLGDLGANGTPIPVGKLALYTAIAGVKPHQCLPIVIDVGTNNQENLKDPLYIGLRQERVRGKEYDDLIDEFMDAIVRRYGSKCLVQFEDFGNQNAFRLMNKYKNDYLCFNDDIQGTAGVAVAGVLAAVRILKKKVSDLTVVFFGAGECNLGIGQLITMAMTEEGTPEAEARRKLWYVDSKGLIVKDRPSGGISEHKRPFAHEAEPMKDLLDVVKKYKPDVLIGAATIAGTFTKEILETMAAQKERPVIFALSNPTVKAECTAEQAYTYTDGRCIFASGSPFPEFTYKGKTHHPGQSNNAYIFPAVGMAAICAGLKTISDDVFLQAAEALASIVSEEQLDKGCLFPSLTDIRETSTQVTTKLLEKIYKKGLATVMPEPCDKGEFLRSQMYKPEYMPALPPQYPIPNISKY